MVASSVARESPPWFASSIATVFSIAVRCSSVIRPRSASMSASGELGSPTQFAQVSARSSASPSAALKSHNAEEEIELGVHHSLAFPTTHIESLRRLESSPAMVD